VVDLFRAGMPGISRLTAPNPLFLSILGSDRKAGFRNRLSAPLAVAALLIIGLAKKQEYPTGKPHAGHLYLPL